MFHAAEVANNTLLRKAKRVGNKKGNRFKVCIQRIKNKILKKKILLIAKKKVFPLHTLSTDEKTFIDGDITLNRFNGPFQLLHTDVADLGNLTKSTFDSKYCCLLVDLFTYKNCTYRMKSIVLLEKDQFNFCYEEALQKKKVNMKKQTDQKSSQNEIKSFSKKFVVVK